MNKEGYKIRMSYPSNSLPLVSSVVYGDIKGVVT